MKLILKVLLATGWSLNLFASEANPAFLALDVLNNPATKDFTAIIENQGTSSRTKVNFLFFVLNGLTVTDNEKVSIAGELDDLESQQDLSSASNVLIIIKFSGLCSSINEVIKKLGVEQDFLPITAVFASPSAGQIFATWAFIKLFVYRFFASQSDIDKAVREDFEGINVENIVKAYAP